MISATDLSQAILDTAIRLAEASSWEKLRLHDIAVELDITLEDIHQYYAQKDDLVEVWYDRADRAMLRAAQAPGFVELNMRERLHLLIMHWLDTLAQHKTVSTDMLWYKLEPGHVHLQILGILRISRTVQWIREASQQDNTHLQRILEEIGLTSIYLVTFLYWMNDYSENQSRTRRFLDRKLHKADTIAQFTQRWCPPCASRRAGETTIPID